MMITLLICSSCACCPVLFLPPSCETIRVQVTHISAYFGTCSWSFFEPAKPNSWTLLPQTPIKFKKLHYFGVVLGEKLSNVLLATRQSLRKAHRVCCNVQVRRLRWSSGSHAGLWFPSSRVQTWPKPLDFSVYKNPQHAFLRRGS
jgi:hypothetical protein